MSILPFTACFGFGWDENLKPKMRTKKDSLILKSTFWVLANHLSLSLWTKHKNSIWS